MSPKVAARTGIALSTDEETPQSGLGCASVALLVPAMILLLVARPLRDEPFALASGSGLVFAALGLALGIGGLLSRERRRRLPAIALVLHVAVALGLLAAVPARDPLGRTYALGLGAAIVLLCVLGGMALSRHGANRARELAVKLGLRPPRRGRVYRGSRSGLPVELEIDSFPILRVWAHESAPFAFRFAAGDSKEPEIAERLCDEELRDMIASWLGSSRDACLECQPPRSEISASRSLAVDLDDVTRIIDHAAALVRKVAERSAHIGPVRQIDGTTILVRRARLAEWPQFHVHFDLLVEEQAPSVVLQVEQDERFRTRIDPSPEERSLQGKWLRLWFSLHRGEEVGLQGELFDAPPFSDEDADETVRFRIFHLDPGRDLDLEGLLPGPEMPYPRSSGRPKRERLCGACRRCGEPYTLGRAMAGATAMARLNEVRIVHCERGLCSIELGPDQSPDEVPACLKHGAPFGAKHELRCLGCGEPLFDYSEKPELFDYHYFHLSKGLGRLGRA